LGILVPFLDCVRSVGIQYANGQCYQTLPRSTYLTPKIVQKQCFRVVLRSRTSLVRKPTVLTYGMGGKVCMRRLAIHSRASDHQNLGRSSLCYLTVLKCQLPPSTYATPGDFYHSAERATVQPQPFEEDVWYFCRCNKQAERNANLRSGRRSTTAGTTSVTATAVSC